MTPREAPAWFDLAGPAGAKAILFIHGTRMTRKMWVPQMEALAGDYRVAAADLPGHGALAGTRFDMEGAVRVITALLDEEAGGRALLVGSSLGGYVSLEAFPGPILFLNGQRDLIFRRNESAFLAAAPNGRLHLIRWGSHRCSLEKPQAFTNAVRGFAQSIAW